jgi:hypothetical protein
MSRFNFSQVDDVKAEDPRQPGPLVAAPASSRKPWLLGITIALVMVMNVALVVAVAVLLLNPAESPDEKNTKPDESKIIVLAEKAIDDYAENMARVCDYMATQVLEKKLHTKESIATASNAASEKGRLDAFRPIGELDNTFFPDEFAGKEEQIAAYLTAMAKGHRRAVK